LRAVDGFVATPAPAFYSEPIVTLTPDEVAKALATVKAELLVGTPQEDR
jgi:hypothetical protein